MWKNLEERCQVYSCLNFSLVHWGTTRLDHHLLPLTVAEGKENFTHCLIKLMYGTRDHPDEFPQSIVNDTCTVTYAVTLAKLVSQAVHFHANSNFL